MDEDKPPEEELKWSVDQGATSFDVVDDPAPLDPAGGTEGRVTFRDEHGMPRRLPADLSRLSPQHRDAALEAMGDALRAGPPNVAVQAALHHLSQMRAAGKITEEQFQKEKARLENY